MGVVERYQAYVDAFEQSARLRDVTDKAMQQWIDDHGAALHGA